MKRFLVAIMALIWMGCAEGPEMVTIEFRLAEIQPQEGLTETTFDLTGESFYLHDEVLISNDDIAAAEAIVWQGQDVVDLKFTESGREKLAQITRQHIKKRMGMLVDGKLVSAPIIQAPILEGRAVIAGNFTQQEARRVARGITAGSPAR
jgi:preprotein translocase subunit SecD